MSKQPWALLDVQATACAAHRKQLPTPWQLAWVRPGDHVKIAVCWREPVNGKDRELFWVQVTALRPWGFAVTVANDLTAWEVHGLDFGMPLEIEYRHVVTTVVPHSN